MDCSTPGFPVLHHLPELAQTHVHRVSDAIQPSHPLSSPLPSIFPRKWKWKVKSLRHVRLFATPWTVAYHVPPTMGFSRQEYWSRLPFPSLEELPNTGIEPGSPTLWSDALPSELPGKSFPESGSFLMSRLFASGCQSIGASASASVLPMNIQSWFPLGLTVWYPCSPRDSRESFPTPQFKSISSLVLSFLYGPALTSIHDYWKNHSFD